MQFLVLAKGLEQRAVGVAVAEAHALGIPGPQRNGLLE